MKRTSRKSAFFLFLHAPAEELFFRGFLQSLLVGLSGSAWFGLIYLGGKPSPAGLGIARAVPARAPARSGDCVRS